MTEKQRGADFVTTQMTEKAIAYRGNPTRIATMMQRAEAGEKLTLVFLGGSITQGSLSSSPETCYAYLVYRWFVNKFKDAEFSYVSAGIGGTTSQFAAARVLDDVISYRPDFCMVEFSVNDAANPFYKEAYEGVIRRIGMSRTQPAMLILNNVFYDSGINAQKEHNEIGRAYDITCISVRDAIRPEIEAGRIAREEISPDGLHPNDYGHAILAELVGAYLESIYREYILNGRIIPLETIVNRPVTVNAMQHLRRIRNASKAVILKGFRKDYAKQKGIRDLFKRGWKASKVGDGISFSFEGSELAIQYRKSVRRPAPIAEAVIDGDEKHPVILDANFREDWGDSLHIDTVLYHGRRVEPDEIYLSEVQSADSSAQASKKTQLTDLASKAPIKEKHTVEIRIRKTHEDDKVPFYLTSFIVG